MNLNPKMIKKEQTLSLLYISLNNILIPLISLSQLILIVRISGIQLWTVLAIGFSLGGIAQAFIDRGYANSGSSLLFKEKHLYFLAMDSIRHRIPVFMTFVIGGLVPSILIESENFDLIYLSYLSFCLSGLSVDWVQISSGRYFQLMLTSAVPRLVASVVGLSAYVFTQSISAILLSAIINSALNVVFGVYSLSFSKIPSENREKKLLEKEDYILRVTNDIIWLMPIPLVNHYSPVIAPMFTFIDRLLKFPLLFVLQNTNQFLMHSMLSGGHLNRSKFHKSLLIHGVTGFIFGIGTLFILPEGVRLISDDVLTIASVDAFYLGIFAFFLFITRSFTQHYFLLTSQKHLLVKVNCIFVVLYFSLYASGVLVYSKLLMFQAILQGSIALIFLCIYLGQEFMGKQLVTK